LIQEKDLVRFIRNQRKRIYKKNQFGGEYLHKQKTVDLRNNLSWTIDIRISKLKPHDIALKINLMS